MPSGRARRIAAAATAAAVFLGMAGVLAHHAVDNALSAEDRTYIPLYLSKVEPLPPAPAYEDELRYIVAVQRAVLDAAPKNEGLPFDRTREPKDLYESGTGLCFDRSRVIEKVLSYSGFQTRHVSIFSTEKSFPLRALATPGVTSHAVTEVRTQRGWLVVDSNDPWTSVGRNGLPMPMERLHAGVREGIPLSWQKAPPNPILNGSYTFVYGLYSRHGRFFPPFNFIPDVHYGELVQNLL